MPDATTLLKFRRLHETHDLCKGRFTTINADLTARGLPLREGTLAGEVFLCGAFEQDAIHGHLPLREAR